jgi:ATP-dependent DNA ligase
MLKRGLPTGSSYQPVERDKPPAGGLDWVHDIKHDGYRFVVRRFNPYSCASKINNLLWLLS